MLNEFPSEGMELTNILVVTDIEKSKAFYQDILGAKIYLEYCGTSCVFNFQGNWLLLVIGGEPTNDKPDISFSAPSNPNTVSHSMTIRVPDCKIAYNVPKSRGAEFLTPPVDWGAEIRCFFRNPDGHLLEISQAI